VVNVVVMGRICGLCRGAAASNYLEGSVNGRRPGGGRRRLEESTYAEENVMLSRKVRRGISNAQYAVVLALVTLAVVAGVTLLGSGANNKLNQTASDVANPAALTQRFGTGS
jgi:Flp pilus assembly pilin Flp